MTVNINSAALAAGPAKAISISDVNLYYGALHVLKNINLEIQPGNSSPFSARPAAARPRFCG